MCAHMLSPLMGISTVCSDHRYHVSANNIAECDMQHASPTQRRMGHVS